ncbi:hypothetical protein [Gaetbulibacter saemankumensis]|uniref:hypothetical protein n=1 Tax=Gaetbulibacter saemankumensis TaxID=311208 RepID=UPI0004009720|nr:hypothetical protein [Gaetbulibacter saemankumensis]
MQNIISNYLCLIILFFCFQLVVAQDSIPAMKNARNIEMLNKLKEKIKEEEKQYLKEEIEAINKRLENEEITAFEAQQLKKEAAKITALNIENRLGIVDNKIALFERNDYGIRKSDTEIAYGVVINNNDYTIRRDKKKKYDKRTKSDFVLAFGFNNAIVEGEKFDDSPYKFGGSRFFEIGWAWKTRVLPNSNFLRIKYGASLQINGLKPDNNRYFVQDNNLTYLEEYPVNLKKSKLSISNLVFPVHIEFGPSKKREYDNYFRYSTDNQFKIGIGGYGGFNVGTRQKLKYRLDGERVKEKQKRGFNISNLVYGVSGYIAFDEVALYVKYDLSPIFRNQLMKQNNISLGVRFDVN